MTSQRMTILHVLRHAGGHLSPSRVFELSRRELPSLTEPTVYRTLEFLARNGFAVAFQTGNGKLAYELAEKQHHHLVCRRCGRTLEVTDRSLGAVYRELEISSGYRLDTGHLTLFGLCPACQGMPRS